MNPTVPHQQRLVDAAHELARDFELLPPGSVLRCFFRAARQARLAGVPLERLPEVAREQAHVILVGRVDALQHGELSARATRTEARVCPTEPSDDADPHPVRGERRQRHGARYAAGSRPG